MSSPEEPVALRDEISPNHRRVISVRLRVLREACQKLLDLSQTDNSEILRRTPIGESEAAEIRGMVRDLDALMTRITSDLALEDHHVDARREAAAIVSGMVVDMEELYPRFLRGYGKVTPGLSKYLETHIEQCLQVVEKMRLVLASSHENGATEES